MIPILVIIMPSIDIKIKSFYEFPIEEAFFFAAIFLFLITFYTILCNILSNALLISHFSTFLIFLLRFATVSAHFLSSPFPNFSLLCKPVAVTRKMLWIFAKRWARFCPVSSAPQPLAAVLGSWLFSKKFRVKPRNGQNWRAASPPIWPCLPASASRHRCLRV